MTSWKAFSPEDESVRLPGHGLAQATERYLAPRQLAERYAETRAVLAGWRSSVPTAKHAALERAFAAAFRHLHREALRDAMDYPREP